MGQSNKRQRYAVSNRLIYLTHECKLNIITKSSLFDILIHRYQNGDKDAHAYLLRLSGQYRHRPVAGKTLADSKKLPSLPFIDLLCNG